jgi:hypothetical protein
MSVAKVRYGWKMRTLACAAFRILRIAPPVRHWSGGNILIRRIRKHAARQDWFAVAVDLAIVVIGVYLGIQASNWNQDRQDRSVARELLTQVIGNLKANEDDLRARSSYYAQVQKHAIAALNALDAPSRQGDEAFLVDAYQASQAWRRPFQRTAFDELQNSGLASKIGDVRTRAAISAYSVTAQGFDLTGLRSTDYREQLRRTMDLRTQKLIRAKCDDRMQRQPSGGEAPALPESCHLGLEAADAERAAERVKTIPEMDKELTRLIIDIDQKQALFARMLRDAAELRGTLERQ